MTTDGDPAPLAAHPREPGALRAQGAHDQSDREAQLRLAFEATGLALWTWDTGTGRVTWSPGQTWLATATTTTTTLTAQTAPTPSSPPREVGDAVRLIRRAVHVDDRQHVLDALAATAEGADQIDVEFRVTPPNGVTRWLLARGAVSHSVGSPADPEPARRFIGILLDVTERALARTENSRLLQAERRASRRAGAIQRIATALSEAATTEQVAAVMVEESLRSLGVGAARIQLRRSDPVTGALQGRSPDVVVRSAGGAQLLAGLPPIWDCPADTFPHGSDLQIDTEGGRTRISLALADRRRYRGRWSVAWVGGDPPVGAGGPLPAPLWSPSEWTSDEGLGLLRTLAAECGQAIDRAELYEQQRDIATILQRTLLPSILPEAEGAVIAARYQPGGQGVDVGGDWYDVINLADGRTGLVIGDVEGHSAAAAAVMGQVRNAMRAYAVEGSTPASVMERVNRLLVRLRVTQLVSCCYLEFAPSAGTATVVLAGHPPPLLITPDAGCDFVRAPANLMLGIEESMRYVETTVLLDAGSTLLLYTDGLVESASRSLPEGLAALRTWASTWNAEDPPDQLVERLIRLAGDGQPVLDDVAVLALGYRPEGRVAPHRDRVILRTFPLDPTSASAARRFVGDVLTQWNLEHLIDQTALMASELVTNSVLHTSGELELALSADAARLRVEVVDHSERLPALQTPDTDAPGGRGLLIIQALADKWGVNVRGAGKAVWFEIRLGTTAPVP